MNPSPPVVAAAAPLTGQKVIVTRSPDRAGALVHALREAGAEPLLLPLIDFEAVDFSCADLAEGLYDWLVVSSITTIRALKAAARAAGHPGLAEAIPAQTKVATIGPSSRAALEAEGVPVALAPEGEQSAAGLASVLPRLDEQRVWLPQSDLAGSLLARKLEEAGAQLTTTIVYRTVDYPAQHRLEEPLAVSTAAAEPPAAMLSAEQARELIVQGALSAVIAASPSAAERIADQLAPLQAIGPDGSTQTTRFIAIGGPTSRAAAARGLDVAAVAAEPTPAGIVAALKAVTATQTALCPPG